MKKEFFWNDKLVKEFVEFCYVHRMQPGEFDSKMNFFKKNKEGHCRIVKKERKEMKKILKATKPLLKKLKRKK